jgi:ribose/xylose/arabinose/galactoside ABC-type transport system permease subunit
VSAFSEKLSRWGRERPWLAPLAALVVVYLLFVALSPDTFARPANLVTMARQTAVVGVAASGMTMIIMLGGIDLSVGSAVALTTVVVASLLKAGAGPWAAALSGVGVAALTGAVNGALIAGLGLTPFIVTLGSMSVLRGVATGLAPAHGFLVFPSAVWLMLAAGVAAAVVLRRTRFGRHVVAIGSSEETARLCGVAVKRVKILVYTLSAALAGVAGVIEFGKLTVGDPTDSVGLELDVIASVVLGGGSLSGGEGSVFGALIGGFLMTVIKTGSTHLGLPNWVQQIITGGIIVTAGAIDRLRRRRA